MLRAVTEPPDLGVALCDTWGKRNEPPLLLSLIEQRWSKIERKFQNPFTLLVYLWSLISLLALPFLLLLNCIVQSGFQIRAWELARRCGRPHPCLALQVLQFLTAPWLLTYEWSLFTCGALGGGRFRFSSGGAEREGHKSPRRCSLQIHIGGGCGHKTYKWRDGHFEKDKLTLLYFSLACQQKMDALQKKPSLLLFTLYLWKKKRKKKGPWTKFYNHLTLNNFSFEIFFTKKSWASSTFLDISICSWKNLGRIKLGDIFLRFVR